MPITDPGFTWQEALWAFGVIAVVAFLVTRVLTDLLRIPRTPYIAMLFVAALGLGAAGYCAWSGTSAGELFTSAVGWALIAGLVAATIAVPLVRHLPGASPRDRVRPRRTHAVGNAPRWSTPANPIPERVVVRQGRQLGTTQERARMVAPVQFPAPRAASGRRAGYRSPQVSRCKMEPCGGRTTPSHRDVYQGLARVQRPIVAVGGDA